MKAHLASITALLTPHTVYPTEAPAAPSMPYYLLWASGGTPGVEQAVDDVRLDIDAMVGVTTVATSDDGVRIAQAQARAILAPSGRAKVLTVTGRSAILRLADSRPVEVDTDVVYPGTGSPFFGVDMYRLISTPA